MGFRVKYPLSVGLGMFIALAILERPTMPKFAKIVFRFQKPEPAMVSPRWGVICREKFDSEFRFVQFLLLVEMA